MRPRFVAAGLLVMLDGKRHVRVELGATRDGKRAQTYAAVRLQGGARLDSIWDAGWALWPLAAGAKEAYVRLERRGEGLRASLSPDGKKWTHLGGFGTRLPAKLKVGVAAFSTSKAPFKAVFDRFKLTPLRPGGKLPGADSFYVE